MTGTDTKTPKPKYEHTVLKTVAFDSVGTRKYALQVTKAGTGNPCLKIVEGRPQDDGTFRKTSIWVWSEDFSRLFDAIDEIRAFITENKIKTPVGHKYDPTRKSKWNGRRPQ